MLSYSIFENAYLAFLVLAVLATAYFAYTDRRYLVPGIVCLAAVLLLGIALNKGIFLQFSESYLGAGDYDLANLGALAATIVAIVLGAVTKTYIDEKRFKLSKVLLPILLTPLLLLPLVPKITENIDSGLWGLVTVFCLAYQSGYFWTDILKKASG